MWLDADLPLDYAVVRRLTHTANNLLSAFYLDIAKDVLYADRVDSEQRRAFVAVTDQVRSTLGIAVQE